MSEKPTYEELEQMVQELEKANDELRESEKKYKIFTEEALKESEEKYRNILENIEDGYYEVDTAGNFTFFNNSMCRILGYSADELMGMNNREYMDGENAKKIFQVFHEVYQTGIATKALDWKLIKKDGSECYVETVVSLITDLNNNKVGFRGVARDVSERKQAEAMLQKERATLSTIFESNPHGIALINKKGKYLYVNPMFTKITGYTFQDVQTGREWFQKAYPDPEYRKAVIDAWKKDSQQEGVGGDYGFKITCKGGQVKDIEFRTTYLKDHSVSVLTDVSHRKRAEEELRESEGKFRSFSEQSLVGIYLIQDNVFKYVNPKFAVIFGYTVEECLNNMPFYDLVHPDDRDTVEEQVRKRASGEVKSVHYSFRGIKRNGEIIDVEIFGSSIFVNGKSAVTGTMLDITERKKTEFALKESEEKYRLIVQNQNDLIVKFNLQQKIIYASPSYCSTFGKTEKELLGCDFKPLIHPKDIPNVQVSLASLTDAPHTTYHEERAETVNGWRWFGWSAKAALDNDGKIKEIVSVGRDITERKKVEKSLAESEARLKKAQSVAKIGNWEYDIARGEVWGSEQAFQIYGIERTSPYLPLDKVEACIPDAPKVNQALIDLIQKNKKYDIEFEVHREIDEKVILIHSLAELVCNNEVPKKVLGIIHDITEQRKLEIQLQKAQKIESIGTLAGGIAHDFNNILFPIVGYAEMLLEDIPADSPLRNNLDEIYIGSLRARDLVKQILTFSRPDRTEIKLMRIQPVIEEALKLIRSTIPTPIEIKQDIQNNCGIIKADPTQIHQIIMNLATNAYHAMEDTGGELKVNLKQIELGEQDVISPDMEPGPYACLTIVDTGIGIDKKLTEKIFDPFFTTKELGKGTGMGLSVVHGIVHNAGGSIHVYSQPGKGTEFHVYLPVVKSSSEQHEIQTKEPIQHGTERILLVDDETPIVTMEKQLLERLGYSVTSRTSSLEALEAFRANPDKFDVVITDMAMPNMSGDKLAAELIKIRPDIPILLCTGFSEKISEEKAASTGIKGFLMKPIRVNDISKKIRELLDNKETD